MKARFRGDHLARNGPRFEPPTLMTIVIAPVAGQHNLATPWWADLVGMPRQCPRCSQPSIESLGVRHKQAHDEHHRSIPVRRGICRLCATAFTFLPWFSPPYARYTWFARVEAMRRYFLQGRSLEDAAPVVQDADRVAAPSTLRRWFAIPDPAGWPIIRRLVCRPAGFSDASRTPPFPHPSGRRRNWWQKCFGQPLADGPLRL